MHRKDILTSLTVLAILFTIGLLAPNQLFAHCDGLDGLVIKAAQKALETGQANLVLMWVQTQDEAEIKEAFQKTVAVRQLSPEAQELTDRYFFETLVRVHRAGEGAPYTGLKPARRDLGPAIPAADQALEAGSAESLLRLLLGSVHDGILGQFKEVMTKKHFDNDDVAAGQAYVRAYVLFIHYVERLYEAANHPVSGHFPESEEAVVHK
jgi:Family of unknown function (DUF6448)